MTVTQKRIVVFIAAFAISAFVCWVFGAEFTQRGELTGGCLLASLLFAAWACACPYIK